MKALKNDLKKCFIKEILLTGRERRFSGDA
jgi:hypothetical protein